MSFLKHIGSTNIVYTRNKLINFLCANVANSDVDRAKWLISQVEENLKRGVFEEIVFFEKKAYLCLMMKKKRLWQTIKHILDLGDMESEFAVLILKL